MSGLLTQFSERFHEQLHRTRAKQPLATTPDRQNILVGYSGGLDSSVLLHLLIRTVDPSQHVVAVHLDHGWSAHSKVWVDHCQRTASSYAVDFICHALPSGPPSGQSREAWARDERYQFFKSILGAQDILLTAHHLDDQIETFFLRLLRGAGPHGLAAIHDVHSFGPGLLIRPLLTFSRSELLEYADSEGLDYIEDFSNRDLDLDRNYLRHRVLPNLRARWPQLGGRISQAVDIQQQLARRIDIDADEALRECKAGPNRISRDALLVVTAEERFWILRRWLANGGYPLPENAQITEFERIFFKKPPTATACVHWKGVELRHYRGQLYLTQMGPDPDPTARISWRLDETLILPHGTLRIKESFGEGLGLCYRGRSDAVVTFYQKRGERCRPANRARSQKLKKLFQEWGVPPWLRCRAPIIEIDGQIAAVVPYCITRDFAAAENDQGLVFEFEETVRDGT